MIRVAYLDEGGRETAAVRSRSGPATRVVAVIASIVVVLGVVPTFAGIAWLMTVLGLR